MNYLAMTFRNRRQLAVLITVATLFLVFLGMRIPYLHGDFQTPKRHPRAVVEDVVKLNFTLDQQGLDPPVSIIAPFPVDFFVSVAVIEVKPVVTHHFYEQIPAFKQFPPRAPPLIFA